LKGMKHVVITGVSRGLVRAAAIDFAADSWTVIGCGTDTAALQSLGSELGPDHRLQSCDVTDPVCEASGTESTLNRSHRVWSDSETTTTHAVVVDQTESQTIVSVAGEETAEHIQWEIDHAAWAAANPDYEAEHAAWVVAHAAWEIDYAAYLVTYSAWAEAWEAWVVAHAEWVDDHDAWEDAWAAWDAGGQVGPEPMEPVEPVLQACPRER
jgi:NAD(P)-dependent dehydrogenase (short-subunit alcohol dehydrogenase family)